MFLFISLICKYCFFSNLYPYLFKKSELVYFVFLLSMIYFRFGRQLHLVAKAFPLSTGSLQCPTRANSFLSHSWTGLFPFLMSIIFHYESEFLVILEKINRAEWKKVIISKNRMQLVNLQIQIDRTARCDLAAASNLSRSGTTGPRASAQSLRSSRLTAHGRTRSHWTNPRGNSWNAAQRPAESPAALHRLF